jgi:hypothetical protein
VAAHQAENKPRFLAPLPSFKQRLCYLLLKKHRTRKQCERLVPRFLRAVYRLRQAGLAQLVQFGQTLAAWWEKSSPCGASPVITGSPKAFTTKWSSSVDKPTASGTSKTIDFVSRYYVLSLSGIGVCPRCWRRAELGLVDGMGFEPTTPALRTPCSPS